jgi:ATP-dependent helicase IRC3
MTLRLRPYQEECLTSIHEHYAKGVNRQLVSLPTAAGKTVIFANLISQMKKKTLVLAHTTELLDQARDKITMISPDLDVGLVKGGRKEFDCDIVVSTIQSARQPETLEEFKRQGFSLCIYDEAHRAAASSPRQILSDLGFFDTPENLLVGFSASPFRSDAKGLGEIFSKVVFHRSIKELIKLGYLCKPIGVKIKSDLDLSTVQTENGDFKTESLASYMNTPEMVELTVEAWLEKAIGRKTIAFGVTVSHAQNLAEAFKKKGITSEAIHGGMEQGERSDVLNRFKDGAISILTNCSVLVEGFDSCDTSCVLIAKPTQSKGLFIQMAGRSLRLFPNKRDALILDFGSKTHSLSGMTELLEDSEPEGIEKKQPEENKISEFVKTLPPSINKKLKAALIEFDPLSESFTWVKEGQSYSLRANGSKTLKIFPTAEGLFSVMFFDGNSYQTIAEKLSFSYAFCCAESFAKENRDFFTISDLEAEWRQKPISRKQQDLFRSFGFRSGVSELSRGAAALIISSGVLSKKASK